MNCAIIGSTKISKIHSRELIKNKIRNITFVSRNKKKSKKFVSELNNEQDAIFNYDNHLIFKKKKFDIISICSKSEFHYENIIKIPKQKTKILIEKPIISLKKGNNFKKKLDKIYLKHKNIFVSYPMYYLGQSFKKFSSFKNKKIEKIDIYYQTVGKHSYREIFLDLAPHAFGLIFSLIKFKDEVKIDLYKTIILKNKFSCSGKLDNINFSIKFIQDPTKPKSIFNFFINDEAIKRVTKYKKNNFLNYLEYKNKLVSIENPMSQVVKNFLNKKNKKSFNINKKLTYLITEISQKIYDRSY